MAIRIVYLRRSVGARHGNDEESLSLLECHRSGPGRDIGLEVTQELPTLTPVPVLDEGIVVLTRLKLYERSMPARWYLAAYEGHVSSKILCGGPADVAAHKAGRVRVFWGSRGLWCACNAVKLLHVSARDDLVLETAEEEDGRGGRNAPDGLLRRPLLRAQPGKRCQRRHYGGYHLRYGKECVFEDQTCDIIGITRGCVDGYGASKRLAI